MQTQALEIERSVFDFHQWDHQRLWTLYLHGVRISSDTVHHFGIEWWIATKAVEGPTSAPCSAGGGNSGAG
jgi:hypothetical protein